MLMPHICAHCTHLALPVSLNALGAWTYAVQRGFGVMLWAAAVQELQVELVYKAHTHPAEGFVAREGDDVSRLLRSLADHPSLRAVQAHPRADGGRLGLWTLKLTPYPCITTAM